MEKFLKGLLIGLSTVAVLGVIIVGVLIYQATNNRSEKTVADAESSLDTKVESDAKLEKKITEGNYIPKEDEFQWILHRMTHQKVAADEKDGATEMTPERIDELLKTLDETDYDNKDVYLEILNEWDKGKFENAVEAHNEILSLQGGTIGVATRLFTPEEEQEFIEQNFR
ncbi:hypothetical protein J7E81_25835 [Bacillus sp. ISL-18]|uniref:DUF6241 domain-containing protein n=1 Tax=Bacillus sp. ISL-18 TaxID=2819118 RepID=UPI001BE6B4F1|nr:DUF6241 domain-containing protein [Bacillus sp. ISL-18]MBT2658597.1 hypothetical protein [Bacillus sp. ISL-18]